MRRHKAMVDLVIDAAKQGKVLAAICHGPWMLCSSKAIQGKKITGYMSIRDDVENAGGGLARRRVRGGRELRHEPHAR